MKKVARIRSSHPLVRKFAISILHYFNVPSNAFIEESRAIGEYIKDRVRYVRDPDGVEYLQDPVQMILDLKSPTGMPHGDCDDMALLVATMLLSIGHYPKFKAIRYSEEDKNYNHIYVVDHDSNLDFKTQGTLVIDCIFKDRPIGYEVNYSSGMEYEIP